MIDLILNVKNKINKTRILKSTKICSDYCVISNSSMLKFPSLQSKFAFETFTSWKTKKKESLHIMNYLNHNLRIKVSFESKKHKVILENVEAT